jgi:hypothetical protein
MKINEIVLENQVNEGIFDKAKAVGAGIKGAAQGLLRGAPIQGAKAGVTASTAASKQTDLINRVVQKAVQAWATHSQTLTTAGTPPKPADAVAWFTKFSGGASTPSTAPSSIAPAAMQQWLTKEVAQYMAKKGTASPVAPTADTTQQPQTQQPQTQQPQTQQPQVKPILAGAKTAAGTEVVKPEPLTLKYKNQNYVRGGQRDGKDTGEWTRFGSTKPLPQSEQAFLDSEEDELARAPQTQPASDQTQAGQEQPQQVPNTPDISKLSKAELKQLLNVLQGVK